MRMRAQTWMFSRTNPKFRPIFGAVILLAGAASICTAAKADSLASDPVCDYLHANRLPLVEAQTIVNARGGRSVLLYGYVATAFGKLDAEELTQDFMDDPDVPIIDRIVVRPELLTMTPGNSNSSADGSEPAADNASAEGQEQSDGNEDAPE
jgi:hypothetical protein